MITLIVSQSINTCNTISELDILLVYSKIIRFQNYCSMKMVKLGRPFTALFLWDLHTYM